MGVLGRIQDDRGSMRNQVFFLFYFLCCFFFCFSVCQACVCNVEKKERENRAASPGLQAAAADEADAVDYLQSPKIKRSES